MVVVAAALLLRHTLSLVSIIEVRLVFVDAVNSGSDDGGGSSSSSSSGGGGVKLNVSVKRLGLGLELE